MVTDETEDSDAQAHRDFQFYLYVKRANYSYAGLNCFIVYECATGCTAIEDIQNKNDSLLWASS